MKMEGYDCKSREDSPSQGMYIYTQSTKEVDRKEKKRREISERSDR